MTFIPRPNFSRFIETGRASVTAWIVVGGITCAASCGWIGEPGLQGANVDGLPATPIALPDEPLGQTPQPSSASDPQSPNVAAQVLPQFGWSGIIGNGQSLSVGFGGAVNRANLAVPHAYVLADSSGNWLLADPNAATLALAPLLEPLHAGAHASPTGGYPTNIGGMTPHATMASQIDAISQALGLGPWITLHSVTGISGQPMSAVGPGGTLNSYAAGLFEAEAMTRLAAQHNMTLHYDAVILTHGETDASSYNPNYGLQLDAMQRAYQADLSAITGQGNRPIYLILSQQNSQPIANNAVSLIGQAQWLAAVNNPAIICAGPKYQYMYNSDHLHFPGPGYRRLGEKYGQVYAQTVILGKPFLPLYPTHVSRPDARTVRVDFHVPVPPLNWDPVLPAPHQLAHPGWSTAHGFEVQDANAHDVAIAQVVLGADGTSVEVVLAQDQMGALSIGYAVRGDVSGNSGGYGGGRMGHLRDSDPMVGQSLETRTCQALAGSPNLICDASMANRAAYDVVQPGDHTVMGFLAADGNGVVLEAPWAKPSGSYPLQFHHEQRNYAVAFSVPCAALN